MKLKEQQQLEQSQFIQSGRQIKKRPKPRNYKVQQIRSHSNYTFLLISFCVLSILAYFYFGGLFNFAQEEEQSYKNLENLENSLNIINNNLKGETSRNNLQSAQKKNLESANTQDSQPKVRLEQESKSHMKQIPKLPQLKNQQKLPQQNPQKFTQKPEITKQKEIAPVSPIPTGEILQVDQYPKGLKVQMHFQSYQIDTSKPIPDEKKVTAVFTSCNRYDLLDKTLTTFYKYNSYPLEQFIVVQDGHFSPGLELIMKKFPQITWLITGKKIGQLAAIDEAYKLIRTPYVFHSQDDWEFLHSGFIQESFEYFEKIPNLIQLWIRKHNHPIDPVTRITESQYTFSLNPGLKKMSDYEKVGRSYSKFTNNVSYGKGAGSGEIVLTKFYKKSGYVVAQSQIQYTKHLGQKRGLGKVFKRAEPAKIPAKTQTGQISAVSK